MKVKFTDRFSTREGREAEVTEAAGRRLIAQGTAEEVGQTKPEPKSEPAKQAPAAKKSTAKKAAKKS
jgi:topoisomerase IA-like protein